MNYKKYDSIVITLLLILMGCIAALGIVQEAQAAKPFCSPQDVDCWEFVEKTCLSGFIPAPLRQICHRYGVNWKKVTPVYAVPGVEPAPPYPAPATPIPSDPYPAPTQENIATPPTWDPTYLPPYAPTWIP